MGITFSNWVKKGRHHVLLELTTASSEVQHQQLPLETSLLSRYVTFFCRFYVLFRATANLKFLA